MPTGYNGQGKTSWSYRHILGLKAVVSERSNYSSVAVVGRWSKVANLGIIGGDAPFAFTFYLAYFCTHVKIS